MIENRCHAGRPKSVRDLLQGPSNNLSASYVWAACAISEKGFSSAFQFTQYRTLTGGLYVLGHEKFKKVKNIHHLEAESATATVSQLRSCLRVWVRCCVVAGGGLMIQRRRRWRRKRVSSAEIKMESEWRFQRGRLNFKRRESGKVWYVDKEISTGIFSGEDFHSSRFP